MNLVKFQGMLMDAMSGNTLVVAVLAVFALIVAIGAVAVYLIACTINKKTQMTGMIRVRLTLNEWPDAAPGKGGTKLVFGDCLISMRDPEAVRDNRLDPKITPMQKAYCRQYWVGELLRRFTANYISGGMAEDASGILLQRLLKDNVFCADLGKLSRRSAKKGLRVSGNSICKQDKKNLDKVSVFAELPSEIASDYAATTGCEAKMLCVTMEYYSRDMKEAGV